MAGGWARLYAWRPSTLAVDIGIACVVAGVELYNLYYNAIVEDCPHCPVPLPLATGLLLLTAQPLAMRSRFPFITALVVGTASFTSGLVGVDELGFGAVVAVFTVASLCPPGQRRIAAVIITLAVITNPFLEGDLDALPEDVVTYGGAWVLGALWRTRRAYTQELELKTDSLQLLRAQEAKLAAAEERSRIARELHDVLAHSMSVMVVQTQGARSVMASDPARADEALAGVEATGRRSLIELRRMLGLLRVEGEAAELAPQPGLEMLNQLVEEFRAAGLRVDVESRGAVQTLAPSVSFSAYRIVQESLTNALRHSGSTTATVTLIWSQGSLAVEVRDVGPGPKPSVEPGHGLVGMRERAALVGGTLEAGPADGNGFVVRAELPLGETP